MLRLLAVEKSHFICRLLKLFRLDNSTVGAVNSAFVFKDQNKHCVISSTARKDYWEILCSTRFLTVASVHGVDDNLPTVRGEGQTRLLKL